MITSVQNGRVRNFFLFAFLMIFLVSCSSGRRLAYETPQEAFEKGVAAYEKDDFQDAIELFRGVFDFGRANEYADDAQLYLARAYAGNGEYILAVNEYTRFVNLYRSDPRSKDAEYELLITYYKQSPLYQLDQTDTERALQHMNIYLQRYPGDDHQQEVNQMISELNEKLARKSFESARTYERRGYYQAAAISFLQILDNFPTTSWVDDALVGAMRAYIGYARASIPAKKDERLNQAIDTYHRLVELYPSSDRLRDAEALYAEASAELSVPESL